MEAVKVFLLSFILLLFMMSLTITLKNASDHMQCEESVLGIFEKMAIWIGMKEHVKMCLTPEEIIERTILGLARSILFLVIAETFRTVLSFYLLEEKSMEITMTEKGFKDDIFTQFYWNQIHRQTSGRVLYNYIDQDCQGEIYLIKRYNILTVETTAYNGKTGEIQTWIIPRLFSC